MNNTTRAIYVGCLVIGTWLTTAYFYSQLPQTIATHWNMWGQVDHYGNKSTLLFLLAFITFMAVLFRFLPLPIKKGDASPLAEETWNTLQCILLSFFGYIYLVFLYISLHPHYQSYFGYLFIYGFSVFFIFIGNYFGKLKQNHFVGIRVPPVFRSEAIWNKTHRVAGWLYVIAGFIMIAATLLPETIAYIIFFTTIMFCIIFSVGYAYYLEYKDKKAR